MRTLRIYVLKEHLGPFLVIVSGLTAVLLAGNIVKLAELVITKGVSPFDILRLLVYLVPHLMSFTIPIACLIAMVMTFGRLSGDYELIALRASGIPPARLIAPLLTAALVISGFVLILNDRIIPHSHLAFRRQLKVIGIKRPSAYLEAGTFIRAFSPYIIFVYAVEKDVLYNIRIYEPQEHGPTRTIIARRGKAEPLPHGRGVRLDLYDGTADEWDPAKPGSFYKVGFTSYSMRLTGDPEAVRSLGKKLKEMTFRELIRERQHLTMEQIETLPISLELHRKVAASFATVVFVTIGLGLGLSLRHHERLVAFVWILGWSIAYYLAVIGGNAVAIKGHIPAWAAMWLPNLLGGAFGGMKLLKAVRY